MHRALKIKTQKNIWLVGASVCILAIYFYLYAGFFSGSRAPIGDDYQQQLPNLLAGYFSFSTNGIFSIPWFNPAQCGGIPFYADPGHGLYSIPTLLTALVNPLFAIKLTFLLFAILGYVGFYLLLRKFDISIPLAIAGATLFLFNGFYTTRMIVGHPFHAFMLVPFIPLVSLSRLRLLPSLILTGIIVGYMFHSAMIHILPPVLVASVIILLIWGIKKDLSKRVWLRFLGGLGIGILLSLSKFVASYSFTRNFPRDFYGIPGFKSIFDALEITFRSLFFRSPAPEANGLLTGGSFSFGEHEFAFGITPVPLILLIVAIVASIVSLFRRKRWQHFSKKNLLYTIAISFLLALPIFLNWYQPAWNAFLQNLPVVGESSSFLRWFALYIPVCILVSICGVRTLVRKETQGVILAGGIIFLTIAYQARADMTFYREGQSYNPQTIVEAYKKAKETGKIPPIIGIGVFTNPDGKIAMPIGRNDVMAQGASQLACYNAVFGYRLESFPFGSLTTGSAARLDSEGFYNFKNPACMIYPAENNCEPGDHFRSSEEQNLEAFLSYKSFDFKKSTMQAAANIITIAAILGLIVGLCFSFWRLIGTTR